MNLTTPEKIRSLRRKLYVKAKAEPDFRFYQLYDKVWREDILHHAYRLARSNKGAPGVDGVSFAMIEAAGLENWLSGIRDELRGKTYRPQPVRRVLIAKPGGGTRRSVSRRYGTGLRIPTDPTSDSDGIRPPDPTTCDHLVVAPLRGGLSTATGRFLDVISLGFSQSAA